MTTYFQIDPIINAWAVKNNLALQTTFKDTEVRSVNVVGRSGEMVQIWIELPEDRHVCVHAWNYGEKKRKWEIPISRLDAALDEAVETAKSWLPPIN